MNDEALRSELKKYISLYENEKAHSETLLTIIDKLLSLIPSRYTYQDPGIAYLKDFGLKPPYKLTCTSENVSLKEIQDRVKDFKSDNYLSDLWSNF